MVLAEIGNVRISLVDGRVVKHNKGTHTGVEIDADD